MELSKVEKGLRNPSRAYQHFAKVPFRFVDRHLNYGTHVFDREWDLLVILDACRYDLFAEFAPRHDVYDRFDSVERIYSNASHSVDWLERTLGRVDGSVLSRTVYISDPGHVEMVDTDDLFALVTVPETPANTRGGVVRPEPITREAVERFAATPDKRFIVQYMQPHAPFLHCIGKYDSAPSTGGHTMNVWKGIRDGKWSKETVWEDYGRNLLTVLDQVEELIGAFEGRIAISSDHGNAMGEFGLYGHPGREAAPAIRAVPWAVVPGDGRADGDRAQGGRDPA